MQYNIIYNLCLIYLYLTSKPSEASLWWGKEKIYSSYCSKLPKLKEVGVFFPKPYFVVLYRQLKEKNSDWVYYIQMRIPLIGSTLTLLGDGHFFYGIVDKSLKWPIVNKPLNAFNSVRVVLVLALFRISKFTTFELLYEVVLNILVIRLDLWGW